MKGYVRSIGLFLTLGILIASCSLTIKPDETSEAKVAQDISDESGSSANQLAATPDPCQGWQDSSGTVFVVASTVGEKDEGRQEIAAILEDGTHCRLLELTRANAIQISPQHKKLIWFAGGNINLIHFKTNEIKIMAPTGGAIEGAQAITFNPAGTQVGIVQQEWETETKENEMPWPKETWRLLLVNLENEEQNILYHGPVSSYPCADSGCTSSQYMRIESLGWSGTTDELLVAVYHWVPMAADILRDVYAFDIETGEARQVMAVEEGTLGVFEDLPRMAPDGRWLAYIMPPDGRTIEIRSIQDGEVSSIQIPDEIGSPRPGFLQWLPGSQHLSFLADNWRDQNQYAGRVFVDTASGQATRLEAIDGDILRWCSADVLVFAEGQDLQRVDLRNQERVTVGDYSTEWVVDCWVND